MSIDNFPDVVQLEPDRPASLNRHQIHLYVVSLPDLKNDLAKYASIINKDEQTRASRFLNPEHGDNYRCVRGLLRQLLSHYLATDAQAIEFAYADHGKPYLLNGSSVHFNLSHSRDMVAYVFYLDADVGVDIEYMRPQKNLEGLIRHVASDQEQIELDALSGDDCYEAFYRLWTRKESLIKAVGRGLGMGLRSINIGTAETGLPLAVEYKNEQLSEWLIRDVSPPTGYKLALCASCS